MAMLNSSSMRSDREEVEQEDAEHNRLESASISDPGRDGSILPQCDAWHRVEMIRTEYMWRPVRDESIEVQSESVAFLIFVWN